MAVAICFIFLLSSGVVAVYHVLVSDLDCSDPGRQGDFEYSMTYFK